MGSELVPRGDRPINRCVERWGAMRAQSCLVPFLSTEQQDQSPFKLNKSITFQITGSDFFFNISNFYS